MPRSLPTGVPTALAGSPVRSVVCVHLVDPSGTVRLARVQGDVAVTIGGVAAPAAGTALVVSDVALGGTQRLQLMMPNTANEVTSLGSVQSWTVRAWRLVWDSGSGAWLTAIPLGPGVVETESYHGSSVELGVRLGTGSSAVGVGRILRRTCGARFGGAIGLPSTGCGWTGLPGPTFERQSEAYSVDGVSAVASNTPRFATCKYGNGIMVERASAPNLLTPNQASVDVATTGLNAYGSSSAPTFVRDTGAYLNAPASAKATSGSVTPQTVSIATDGLVTPVTAGQMYTFDVWAKVVSSGSPTWSVQITWLNSGGGTISVTAGRSSAASATWMHLDVTDMAPTGAVTCYCTLAVASVANTGTVNWDDAALRADKLVTSWVHPARGRAAEMLRAPGAAIAAAGTFECWIKLLDPPSAYDKMLLDTAGSPTHRLRAWVDAGDARLHAEYGTGSGAVEIRDMVNIIFPATLFYVALTWSAAGVVLYLNGSAVVSSLCPPDIVPGEYAYLACGSVPGVELDGLIDDLRISNTARGAAEIAARYVSGVTAPVDATTTLKVKFNSDLTYSVGVAAWACDRTAARCGQLGWKAYHAGLPTLRRPGAVLAWRAVDMTQQALATISAVPVQQPRQTRVSYPPLNTRRTPSGRTIQGPQREVSGPPHGLPRGASGAPRGLPRGASGTAHDAPRHTVRRRVGRGAED